MKSPSKQLLLSQIDRKMRSLQPLRSLDPPPLGWLHAVRTALGMSYRQVAVRLGISPQSVKALEQREVSGTASLKTLSAAAKAMNVKLVYGFVPLDKDLTALIEQQARIKARALVARSSHTMRLEDQTVSPDVLERSEADLAEELAGSRPRSLWD